MEIIYDASTLEGTCYIEIFPNKFKGEYWNAESLFFTEENFDYIMPVFEKCYKNFDYYALNEIELDTWKLIVKELEKMKQYIASNELISMITEFQYWIDEKSVSTKVISVLGM